MHTARAGRLMQRLWLRYCLCLGLVGLSAAPATAQPLRLGIEAIYESDGATLRILVNRVIPGEVADRAGIRRDEIIVSIDDQPIRSEATLQQRLQIGAPLRLEVLDPATGAVRVVDIQDPALPLGPGLAPAGKGAKGDGPFRLTNEFLGTSQSLASTKQGRLSMSPSGQAVGQRWRLSPAGGGRYRLVNELLGSKWALTANPSGVYPTMERTAELSAGQLWKLIPVDKAYRIVSERAGQPWALDSAPDGEHEPLLALPGDGGGQLWTLTPLGGGAGTSLVGTWVEYRTATDQPSGVQTTIRDDMRFVQTSGADQLGGGRVELGQDRLTLVRANGDVEVLRYASRGDRIDFFRSNGLPEVFYWRALPAAGVFGPDLRERLLSRKVVAGKPLPPAKVEMINSHEEELWVLVRDLRDDAASLQLKIPAGQSETVNLDRDAGAVIVETWEIPLRSGEVRVEERRTELAAKQFYNVSVYELFVQSIAIDATKRGKGKIEDVNYSPKSVGAFPIAAGAGQQSGSIDVYKVAVRRRNPGGVDRIDPSEWRSDELPATDPIKKLLRERP